MAKSARARSTWAAGALGEQLRRVKAIRSSGVRVRYHPALRESYLAGIINAPAFSHKESPYGSTPPHGTAIRPLRADPAGRRAIYPSPSPGLSRRSISRLVLNIGNTLSGTAT